MAGLGQRVGSQAAGQHARRLRCAFIIGAAQVGQVVDKDNYVLLLLGQAHGTLQHHFGAAGLAVQRFVKAHGYYLARQLCAGGGDILRAFAQQQGHQRHAGMLRANG